MVKNSRLESHGSDSLTGFRLWILVWILVFALAVGNAQGNVINQYEAALGWSFTPVTRGKTSYSHKLLKSNFCSRWNKKGQ